MIVYPVIAGTVTLVFAILVFQQYRARRRPYQLLWALSIAFGAVGSLAYAAALGGSEAGFRLYYLMGALLVAPWMGLGSVYLVARPAVARLHLVLVAFLSVAGAALLLTAPIDRAALAALDGGPGTGVLQRGPWLAILILLNIYGTMTVVGAAVLSALRLARRQAPPALVTGNALIASGVFLLAAAGTAARLGFPGGFWLTMALGWIVAFAGFSVITAASLPVPERRPA